MSKAKKAKLARNKKPAPKQRRSGYPDQNHSKPKAAPVRPKAAPAAANNKKQKSKASMQVAQTGFSVPFEPSYNILLVGEGDFSFSASLLGTHQCTNLVATTFETPAKLREKHPQATKNISILENAGAKVFYSIDATALMHPAKGGGSNLRKLGPFDRIVFNFPHTGGLTKDVNRQVRANQELCVKFFETAGRDEVLKPGGRIVVTLFEGEPYELWGIRNLARHARLMVVRSTRFEWERYPGYSHARTLGNLRGMGWKGEERSARMYVFGRPGEEEVEHTGQKNRKRRTTDGLSDDEESDGDQGANGGQGSYDELELDDLDADEDEEDEPVEDEAKDPVPVENGTKRKRPSDTEDEQQIEGRFSKDKKRSRQDNGFQE